MHVLLWLAIINAGPPPLQEAREPVAFEFKRSCGPDKDHKQAYDPATRTYYLQVHDIARFEIKTVADDLDRRPVVLRITGMLDKPEGPLTLVLRSRSGNGSGEHSLYHKGYDRDLFRIERKDGVTTIEFLARGKRLLQPGTSFQYIDFYR